MKRERLTEIIEAYGGDPVRWPADERPAAEALIRGDAQFERMAAEALRLDALLHEWASAEVPVSAAAADAAAKHVLARPKPTRWLPAAVFGGAVAASLAIATLLQPSPEAPVPAPAMAVGPQMAQGDLPEDVIETAHDMLVWGSVFTPTPEEEMVL